MTLFDGVIGDVAIGILTSIGLLAVLELGIVWARRVVSSA